MEFFISLQPFGGSGATRRTELYSDYSDLRLCAKIDSNVGVKSHQNTDC